MSERVFDTGLNWIDSTTTSNQKLYICFHGGEPLSAGISWYQRALPLLVSRFGKRLELRVQSNLWLLTEEFCALFQKYKVGIGVSLDGPEEVNDAQRGKGYFAKTMGGIRLARQYGFDVGAICTFTRLSAPYWRQIFDFFVEQDLAFSIHSCSPVMVGKSRKDLSQTPDEFSTFFLAMFDHYLKNLAHLPIVTFDQVARVLTGKQAVCIFSPCLGKFLTVSATGGIYPCNRFVGCEEWKLGMVDESPSLAQLAQSQAWLRLEGLQAVNREKCGDCPYQLYCNGGCPSNALIGPDQTRDPLCPAYKKIFAHFTNTALGQVFCDENLESLKELGACEDKRFLQRGSFLEIMRGGKHPSFPARRAKKVLIGVALAGAPSHEVALKRLMYAGVNTSAEQVESIAGYVHGRELELLPQWHEAYIHVTNSCNLNCAHCYASSNRAMAGTNMGVDQIKDLMEQLGRYGFRSIKITGGEPLVHVAWPEIEKILAEFRGAASGAYLVLRTNLTTSLSPVGLKSLAQSVDHIIVSIDGDQRTHDERRGSGTYAATVNNLRQLARYKDLTRLSLAMAIDPESVSQLDRKSVRELAADLGIEVRMRQILPIGRRAATDSKCGCDFTHQNSNFLVERYTGPRLGCTLGRNLHISFDGSCYPCFALLQERHLLGNVFQERLGDILERDARYFGHTVDSNEQCRNCCWRYLCGGACRIWNVDGDPDSAPQDCSRARKQASSMVTAALDILHVSRTKWIRAGLPID